MWKERVDLPQETKELIVGTIKNELSLNAKCVKESCRKEVRNLENVLDEISYANQLGRLDVISLILALFGLVLGFGVIYGFMHIKERSEDIAKTETERWLKSPDGKGVIKGLAREVLLEKQSNSTKKPSRTKKKLEEEASKIDFGSTY